MREVKISPIQIPEKSINGERRIDIESPLKPKRRILESRRNRSLRSFVKRQHKSNSISRQPSIKTATLPSNQPNFSPMRDKGSKTERIKSKLIDGIKEIIIEEKEKPVRHLKNQKAMIRRRANKKKKTYLENETAVNAKFERGL